MRKATAVIFILMASIVLMVHAVVPHHHHQEQICFLLHGHSSCNTDFPSPEGSCSHHQGTDDNQTTCLLKQLVVVPADFFRITHLQVISKDLPDFFVTPLYSQNDLVPVESISHRLVPSKTPLLEIFHTPSAGLRAPPSA